MPGAVRATFGVCLVVLLTGCSQVEQPRQWVRSTSAATYDKIGMTGKALGAPWGAPRSDVPRDPDSVTISRVFGPNPVVDPLRSEGGLLNAIALLLFIATLLTAVVRGNRETAGTA